MPNNDGTGPDGNGPKESKKGWPKKDGTGRNCNGPNCPKCSNKTGKRHRNGA